MSMLLGTGTGTSGAYRMAGMTHMTARLMPPTATAVVRLSGASGALARPDCQPVTATTTAQTAATPTAMRMVLPLPSSGASPSEAAAQNRATSARTKMAAAITRYVGSRPNMGTSSGGSLAGPSRVSYGASRGPSTLLPACTNPGVNESDDRGREEPTADGGPGR